MSDPIQPAPGGAIIKIYVTPRSSANKVVGEHNGALKVAITAPPVEDAANKALVEFIAKLLGVPRLAVSITAGQSSRHKMVKVEGVVAEEVRRKLQALT